MRFAALPRRTAGDGFVIVPMTGATLFTVMLVLPVPLPLWLSATVTPIVKEPPEGVPAGLSLNV